MSKRAIPQEPAYSGYANQPYKKNKGKTKSKQPLVRAYKQRTEEIHHAQTSRGH